MLGDNRAHSNDSRYWEGIEKVKSTFRLKVHDG